MLCCSAGSDIKRGRISQPAEGTAVKYVLLLSMFAYTTTTHRLSYCCSRYFCCCYCTSYLVMSVVPDRDLTFFVCCRCCTAAATGSSEKQKRQWDIPQPAVMAAVGTSTPLLLPSIAYITHFAGYLACCTKQRCCRQQSVQNKMDRKAPNCFIGTQWTQQKLRRSPPRTIDRTIALVVVLLQ